MKRKKHYITFALLTVFGIGFVTLLFSLSERELHRDNSFTRRFPGHPAIEKNKLDLGLNSYYIAGVDKGNIYLGNVTAPLRLMILDTALQNKREILLSVDQDSLPYRSVQLRVIPPYFYLMDGYVSFFLRGSTNDWKAKHIMEDSFYFDKAEPIDSITFAFRATSSETMETILGKATILDSAKVVLSDKLLQKQIDGVFDVDGDFHYNHHLQKILYTYYYRNQYIVADNDLRLNHYGKTIDTISKAQIKVGYIKSKKQSKMSTPIKPINKSTSTCGNYLFVHSTRIGRLEPLEVWEQASIIDVYDLMDNTYEFSFYIYDIGKDKLKKFWVIEDKFIGMIGNHIVTYQLDTKRFIKMQKHQSRKYNEIGMNESSSGNNYVVTGIRLKAC